MIITEENELDVKNNFSCVICKNIPFAPVMQCEECEYLYCSTERCLHGVTECQNKKCKKSKEFKTSKIGRILRNVMSNFEFKHNENETQDFIKYEKKCKFVLDEYMKNQRFKCCNAECKHDQMMTKDELTTHLNSEC